MKNLITLVKEAFYRPFLKRIIPCWLLFSGTSFLPCQMALALPHPPSVNFSQNPSNKKVCIGGTANFSVVATGASSLTYLWQLSTDGGTTWNSVINGAVYSGAGTATLTVSGTSASFNGYNYRCVVTDNNGPVNSSPALLTVGPLGQLLNASGPACSGGSGGFTAADPNVNYSYLWQVSTDNGGTWNNTLDGATYSGSGTSGLNITANATLNGYLYRTITTDGISLCSVTSIGVDTLHVVNSPGVVQPTPTSAFICPGASPTLSILDSTGVTYQWRTSTDNGVTWNNISNNALYTGTSTFSLAINTPSTPASYDIIRSVTGYGTTCSTNSSPVALTFKTLPAIITPPAPTTVCEGSTAFFRVTTTGSTLSYQWQTDNGSNGTSWSSISPGGTSAILSQASVTTLMEGYQYRVTVTGCGSPLTPATGTLHVNKSGTWKGTTNTLWEQPTNWCGGVPTPTTDVLIPSAAPNMPTISAITGAANWLSLTTQFGSVLTISGGTTPMSGSFTIAGTVTYTGTANQQVMPANFGSLSVSGSGNKILNGNSAITNTLTLGGTAMLVTGNNILTMNAGSNPISGASFSDAPTSWIVTGNGSSGAGNTGTGGLQIAQVTASGTALFPVGPTPSSYTPLQLTNGGATNGFTVAVNDQNIPGAPTGSVVDRTWLVSAVNGGASNISLGLLWNLSDEPHTFNRSSASVVRSNGTAIVEESTAGAAAGSDPYSITKGAFSTLTQFSAATSTLVPLSVQLLSFSGQWVSDAATGLSWDITSQSENSSYIIQRSADGNVFGNIGTVNAEPGKTSYSFVDTHPGKSNFYRLGLVDFSGDITYSRVIELTGLESAERAELAPSVTEQASTSLLLSLSRGSDMLYIMTDITGRTVSRNTVRLAKGEHALPLDISRLPGGIYFVRVTDTQGFNKVLTLIKK